ncbi:unnamed protein product [Ectocarpus fasciculatus]
MDAHPRAKPNGKLHLCICIDCIRPTFFAYMCTRSFITLTADQPVQDSPPDYDSVCIARTLLLRLAEHTTSLFPVTVKKHQVQHATLAHHTRHGLKPQTIKPAWRVFIHRLRLLPQLRCATETCVNSSSLCTST